jgi:hypothetical protein
MTRLLGTQVRAGAELMNVECCAHSWPTVLQTVTLG